MLSREHAIEIEIIELLGVIIRRHKRLEKALRADAIDP
jgi:hypothetical protein